MPLANLLLRSAGGSGAFAPQPTTLALTAAGDGGWSWFMDPRAIEHNGVVYWGYVDGSGNIEARTLTVATGAVSAATTLHATLQADDHAAPSFLVRDSDSRILAFYAAHDDTTMRLRVSSNPESIGSFAGEASLDASLGGTDYSYPVPIQLTGEANDPIYVFYRDIVSAGQYDLVYGKSSDGGGTWAAQVKVADSDAHSYWKIARNGDDRIDFAYTDEHPAYAAGSVYHFYYQGGAYYKSDGTSAGALPLDKTDMTLVYDGSTTRGWVWDIAIEAGAPVIAYAAFPSTSDHRYRYARWNGSVWDDHQIVAAGGHIYGNGDEPYYSGGVSLDHHDPTRVFASVYVGSQWEMYEFSTTDGGATWGSMALTSASASKNIRPAPVWDATGPRRMLWMVGDYTTYIDWDTGTSAR